MNHTRQRSFDDMMSMSGTESPKDDVASPLINRATAAHARSRLKGHHRPGRSGKVNGSSGTPPSRANSTPRRTLSEPMLEIGQFSVNGSGFGLESGPGSGPGSESDDEMINLLATQSVEVELQHVSLTLKNDPTKEILHDVSGRM
jgi:hypothetical protein